MNENEEPIRPIQEQDEKMDEEGRYAEQVSIKGVKDEKMPDEEEVKQHMETHWPFRSWCSHCIRGRGQEEPHAASTGEERSKPVIAVDYMWMKEQDKEQADHEEDDEEQDNAESAQPTQE